MHCNEGKYKGKILTYNPNEETGFYGWYVTNIKPLLFCCFCRIDKSSLRIWRS